MERYMVIVRVDGDDYLCSVSADSAYQAEHVFLDMGICGKHKYSVEACMAYDKEAVKSDTFICSMLGANTISYNELENIITERNEVILASDAFEERIAEIDKLIEEHEKEIALLTVERNTKQMLIEE